MKLWAPFVLLGLCVCGCGTSMQQVVVKRISFPEEEYEALAKTGTAIIRGQAFLRTRGGDVKTAAGSAVNLNPVTSYSLQWYEAVKDGRRLEPPDERAFVRVEQTIADAEGRFEFKDIPRGEYFITTQVLWEVPTGRGFLRLEGGLVSDRLVVEDGCEYRVIINRLLREGEHQME